MELSQPDKSPFVLKLTFEGITKRHRTPHLNFSALNELIRVSFPIFVTEQCCITYCDPEGDSISIANETDWLEALRCMQEEEAKSLKLCLALTTNAATLSVINPKKKHRKNSRQKLLEA